MPTPRLPAFEPDPNWQRSREPVFWMDPVPRLVWANRAWEELTGYPPESVAGVACPAHGSTRSDDASERAASFRPPPEAMAGQPAGTPTLIHRADGQRLWRRVEFWPFTDESGALLGLLGTVRDEAHPPSVPDSRDGRLAAELLAIRRRLLDRFGTDSILGAGASHRRLMEQVRLAAGSSVPVLISGEPGTGKRHVARVIHQHGPTGDRPFLPFDGRAMPAEILERELFGADGPENDPAAPRRRPRLSLGEGSTVLIDEVLALPRDLQARLVAAIDAPFRLIATTAGDPEAAVRDERLRADLYHAMTVLVVRLLPLRDRRDELPALAQHFLERVNRRGGPQRAGFTAEAIDVLIAHDWPGNLPELARVVEHAHSRTRTNRDRDRIGPDDLPAAIRGQLGGAYNPPTIPNPTRPLDELLTEVERKAIETALRQSRSNKSRAAEILGISRPRLYRRIKELNLPDDDPADEPPAD